MLTKRSKNELREKVHTRIRKKLAGTTARPRLNVYRSVNHIYVQLIDDAKQTTIASASSLEQGKDGDSKKHISGGNIASAKQVGKLIAERAKEKGIESVVFDRGGYLYHGRIKAVADAAREGGLKF